MIKMNNMKSFKFLLAGTMLLFAVSCVAPEEWHKKYDDIVPGPVTNVKVDNVNGGAIISYTLPSVADNNLWGAKVVYSLTPYGEQMERWASAERDTIVLEGYGDTDERIVDIYAVHKNGNLSEVVQVPIKPDTPYVFLVRESVQAVGAFGGVQVTWKNPLRKDMGIILYAEDPKTHEMMLFDRYYSNAAEGKTVFRYFEPKEQNFRIEMFDRWQNYATPLEATLIPLEEVEIASRRTDGVPIWSLVDGEASGTTTTTLQRWMYRCDTHAYWDNLPFVNMLTIDNSFWYVRANPQISAYYFPGKDIEGMSIPLPFYFTLDMGRKASYSRVLILHENRQPTFSVGPFTDFAIWGTNEMKAIEDVEDPHETYPKGSREANQAYWSSWQIPNVVDGTDAWKNDGWVKLLTGKYATDAGDTRYYEGMPLTANDQAKYITDGYEFEFNEGVDDAYRYLRFEVIDNSDHVNGVRGLRYIRFWGSYEKE